MCFIDKVVIVSGSQGFPLVPSCLWEAISRKGGIEIMLLPESLCIQTCAISLHINYSGFCIRNH